MHLTLIKLFLTLANALLQNAKEKRLIDGAIAEYTLKGLEDVQNKIAMANDAVRDVDSLPIEDDTANRANNRKVRALRSADNSDLR
jgi:hypothetical protein